MSGRYVICCTSHTLPIIGDPDRLQQSRIEAVQLQIAHRPLILKYRAAAILAENIPGMYDVSPYVPLTQFMNQHEHCALAPYDTEKGEVTA